MNLPCPLILASASPARAQLLRDAGFEFTQVPSHAHEPPQEPGEDITHYVLRLARYKSETVRKLHPDACILTCDTVIQLDNHTLGKPRDDQHAIDMITQLSGRSHTVHTGHMLCTPHPDHHEWTGTAHTHVFFKSLTQKEITHYVHSTTPTRFAGAYAIQQEGANLVDHIEGQLDTVIGLSVESVREGLGMFL